MNTQLLRALAEEWRADAAVLRRRGAAGQAEVLEDVADELERRVVEWEEEELTIAEAAGESGYTEDHLRELVRTGRILDNRPQGSEGRILIRRRDLPRKLVDRSSGHDVVGDLLELLD